MSSDRRTIALVLLGFGFFQIFAAGITAFFWAFAGEWQRYMPTIVSFSLLAWPAAYLFWRRYIEKTR